MTFIHQEKTWPDFQWDVEILDPLLAEVKQKLNFLFTQLATFPPALQAKAELESLTREVLATSSFEGQDFCQEEVRSALAKRLQINIGEVMPASSLVEGYAELILDAVKNSANPLTAERLFAWHSFINPSGQLGMRTILSGAWRSAKIGMKQVISGHFRHERLSYEPPLPTHLSGNMKALIDWINVSADDPCACWVIPKKQYLDPILEAGIAYLWLVAIHPFDSNNGLFGQTLADYVLARSNNEPRHFYSISAPVQRNRKAYYKALESSLRGGMNITPWLLDFLQTVQKAINTSLESFNYILHKAKMWENASLYPVNQRQKKVLHYLLDYSLPSITTMKYAKIAKCSPDTALRDIRELNEFGITKRSKAGGRSTNYELVVF